MTYERGEIFSSANLEWLFKRQIPVTTGKKNKRGARGSSEDENSASKRPNAQQQQQRTTHNALCKEEVEEVRRG